MRPRIGLTATRAFGSDGAPKANVRPYLCAIERYGGEPILLDNDAARASAILDTIDGLLVSGGVDVDPQYYGGNPDHSRSERGEYSAARDAFEIALVRLTRDRGMPTLGICRGLQIANVAFGGTLIEDLADYFGGPSPLDHRQTDDAGVERSDYAPGHIVHVALESAFVRLVGSSRFKTNSMHHQAVRVVGEGLVAVGRTSDGVIEVVDATFDHPFFFAVQWHPEELDDDISAALFRGLIAVAAGTAS